MESSKSSSKIVLDYGDSLLKQSDLNILTGSSSAWLNDNLIGFYFEYLSQEVFPLKAGAGGDSPRKPRLKFFSPQVTQCLKLYDNPEVFIDTSNGELSSYDWLFFAVNNSTSTEAYESGSHWSLLVYSKKEGAFYHLDSSSDMNTGAAKSLFEKLKGLLKPEPSLKKFSCDAQINGYDCGLHVLVNAKLLGDYITEGNTTLGKNDPKVPTASPEAAQAMRSKLAELIKKLGSS